jgi:class 3 adenylate cyclase
MVTFLFTDIEGSTRLWEHVPQAMETALARHDAILRAAIEAEGGQVFKTMGDSFCAAFPTAAAALAAGVRGQHGLRAATWEPETGALKVRMALHTGDAEERGGDYSGPLVARANALLEAGHGGQILLSGSTAEVLGPNLAPGVTLRDMGAQRLKDLLRPEHIFQLVAPDLPAEFPALKTLEPVRTNLPAPPGPLVGRERELAAVTGLLRRTEVRLVTLTGAAGAGKTHLALQVAAAMQDSFPDGIVFVSFADATDLEQVAPRIAGALEGPDAGADAPLDRVKAYLHGRKLLMVFDQFEPVIDAAPLITDLLAAALGLKVLVTSREELALYGEYEFLVTSIKDR